MAKSSAIVFMLNIETKFTNHSNNRKCVNSMDKTIKRLKYTFRQIYGIKKKKKR